LEQSASHDAALRRLRASSLETDAELACRAGDQRCLGGGALRDETDRGLETARVLFQADVLVVVNGDLVLGAEQTRGGKRGHRPLGRHDETLAATGEPAGKSA
jgi:hypothetical protein